MKTILRWLGLFLVFLYLIIVFAPKQQLYYLLEEWMSTQNIILSNETTQDEWLIFRVSDAELYFENISGGIIEEIRWLPLLFYNEISLKNGRFSQEIRRFLPQKIDQLSAVYSVIQPTKIVIDGHGDFGKLSGGVDLLEQRLRLVLEASETMKKNHRELLGRFKKEGDVYVYEIQR